MPKAPAQHTIRGTVIAHNVSPRGHVEGALVATPKGLVQLNFPKDGAADYYDSVKVGATIEVAGEHEDDGDHPVYRAKPAARAVEGTVVRLNYALHGEVNGYHLDDGTFVHVKPDGAKRYKIAIGDRISAEGDRKLGEAAVVIEPDKVTRLGAAPKRAATKKRTGRAQK